MTSRATSADPRAERVRGQMKEAALALVHSRRIEAISVSDIVQRAAVSRQAFYQHFRDRDDAAATAVIEAFSGSIGRRESFEAREPRARIAWLIRHVAEHSYLYRNLYPSVVSQRVAEAFRQELNAPCTALAEGIAECTGVEVGIVEGWLVGSLMDINRHWTELPSNPSHQRSGPRGDETRILVDGFFQLVTKLAAPNGTTEARELAGK